MITQRQDNGFRSAYRLRIALFLGFVLAALLVLDFGLRTVNTLKQLDVVESDRDRWQRPQEILAALGARSGDTISDLGCGAGYFTLKLAPVVGSSGQVDAIDIRAFPLLFVWIRAMRMGLYNVKLIHAAAGDPHLPARVNSVLIVNTFHEITAPGAILDHIWRSLIPGGRLVVVDRAPAQPGQPSAAPQDHDLPLSTAEREIRQAGFEVLGYDEHFVQPPGDSDWWLIVARKVPEN